MTLPLSYSRDAPRSLASLRDFACGLPPFASLRVTPANRLNLEGCDSTTELLPLTLRGPSLRFGISPAGSPHSLRSGSRPQSGSTWKAVTLPLSYSRPNRPSKTSAVPTGLESLLWSYPALRLRLRAGLNYSALAGLELRCASVVRKPDSIRKLRQDRCPTCLPDVYRARDPSSGSRSRCGWQTSRGLPR